MANVSSNRLDSDHACKGSVSLSQAERWCRRLATSHYENFLVATAFLPRRLRQPFFNIYAFCRTADDLADESESPEIALQKLAQFQRLLDTAFTGTPTGEIFVALAHTAEQFSLPHQPFNRLLAAFRQDQAQTRYATRNELLGYCRNSANPVGEILLQLCDCLTPENLALSDEICTGLQLVNFWQDVKRDFEIGRIYLPAETMQRFGVTEAMFATDTACIALRRAIEFECELAQQHFARGLPLVKRVPQWFARDVGLFAQGGLAVLQSIRQIDYDVLRSRPAVGKRTQLGLLVKAWLGRFDGRLGMIE